MPGRLTRSRTVRVSRSTEKMSVRNRSGMRGEGWAAKASLLSVGRPRKVDDGRRGLGQRPRVLRCQVEDKELEAGNIRIVDDHIAGRVRGIGRLERFRGPGQEGDLPAVRGPGEARYAALDRGRLDGFPSGRVDEPDLSRPVPVGKERQRLPVRRPSRHVIPSGTRRKAKGRTAGRLDQPDAAGSRVLRPVDLGSNIGYPVSGRRDPGVHDIPNSEQVLEAGRPGAGIQGARARR